MPTLECEVVRVQVQNEERVHVPRQTHACWLALCLWDRLGTLRTVLTVSLCLQVDKAKKWLDVLKVLL